MSTATSTRTKSLINWIFSEIGLQGRRKKRNIAGHGLSESAIADLHARGIQTVVAYGGAAEIPDIEMPVKDAVDAGFTFTDLKLACQRSQRRRSSTHGVLLYLRRIEPLSRDKYEVMRKGYVSDAAAADWGVYPGALFGRSLDANEDLQMEDRIALHYPCIG